MRERPRRLRTVSPHMKLLDGDRHGYVLLDITRERLQADWYHVRTVTEQRSTNRTRPASCASAARRDCNGVGAAFSGPGPARAAFISV